ncbi:hypothetical protein DFH08DRAFT_808111 [Mycena albidolilacea]|uniref:Uncharacterized protein n=1 Tax=Mycena albidolilacea TaxID=1033008 RepID=A0AAD7A2P4_9AGAR|nr:hypothetical protein DFH08DRAFT_808111 [Mycena albidolilacea]
MKKMTYNAGLLSASCLPTFVVQRQLASLGRLSFSEVKAWLENRRCRPMAGEPFGAEVAVTKEDGPEGNVGVVWKREESVIENMGKKLEYNLHETEVEIHDGVIHASTTLCGSICICQ